MPTRTRLVARGLAATQSAKQTRAGFVNMAVTLWIVPPDWPQGGARTAIDYEPDKLDVQLDAAQTATVRRFWREVPSFLLSAWIEAEARAFASIPGARKDSGRGRLAAALLGIPYVGARQSLAYRAILRALQRAGSPVKLGRKESHETISSPEYRRLIDNYAGDGSPFRASPAALDRARSVPVLAVLGDWSISGERPRTRLLDTMFATDPDAEPDAQTMREVKRCLRNDGVDFYEAVRRHIARTLHAEVILWRVELLAAQASFPTAG